jgi:hypothetical protein
MSENYSGSNSSLNNRKNKSFIHLHSEIIPNGFKCKVVSRNGSVCNKEFHDGKTTSNLIKHLTRDHKILRPSEEEKVFFRIIK